MHARADGSSSRARAIATIAVVCVAACHTAATTSERPDRAADGPRTARLTRGAGEHELARWLVATAIAQSKGDVALVDDTDRVVWGTPARGKAVAIDDEVSAAMRREPLASLAWLVGSWRGTAEGATTTERWCPEPDGRLVGDNRTVVQSREVAFELLAIEDVDRVATYLARPGGRTPATPFARTPTRVSTVANFSNPTHDFPQALVYTREQDRLDVVADGSGQRLAFAWTGPSPTPNDPVTAAADLASQCASVRAANPRSPAAPTP